MKLGIRLESLELPFRKALDEAHRAGAAGVQFDAVGNLSPDALSQTGRREIRHLIQSRDLALCALGCPLRRGLGAAENQDARIDHIRKVMALSYELGARVVIVEAGEVPEDPKDAKASLLTEALLALGIHGDRIGTVLALETGLESAEVLERYLAQFDTGGLGVNLDAANLLMHGFDPYQGAKVLARRVVHVHAKDARNASASRAAQEVPLGHGDIDWMLFLGTLEEIEYKGWLTIERESGDHRLADVVAGIGFLRRFVPN
jgi:sugar phosphate isomerase/epimerase